MYAFSLRYPARIPLRTEDGETFDEDVMFIHLVHNYLRWNCVKRVPFRENDSQSNYEQVFLVLCSTNGGNR